MKVGPVEQIEGFIGWLQLYYAKVASLLHFTASASTCAVDPVVRAYPAASPRATSALRFFAFIRAPVPSIAEGHRLFTLQ